MAKVTMSAFPWSFNDAHGMSLLDFFAAQVLSRPALLAEDISGIESAETQVSRAYEIARAAMKERQTPLNEAAALVPEHVRS